MDDTHPFDEPGDGYRCPGATSSIDRQTHLGRLAAFYPACRDCSHRADVVHLSNAQQRQWSTIVRRRGEGPRFTADGFDADSVNDMPAAVVAQFCRALAAVLARKH